MVSKTGRERGRKGKGSINYRKSRAKRRKS